MNRPAHFVARLALTLCGLSALGAAETGPELKPVDARLFPDLYQWADTCNVYVIRHGDAALLIDLGDGSVLEHLPSIGVNRVEWVLFTHHHREQCQGAPRLAAATRVAAPAVERDLFETPTRFRKLVPRLDDPFTVYGASYVRPPIQPIHLDLELKAGESFAWRGVELHCLETPGHSPGSLSYLLDRGGQTLAFSGDVVLDGAHMHTWFDSEWDYGFGQGLETLIASVDRLAELAPEVLLPSHGPVIRDPPAQLGDYTRKLRHLASIYGRGYPVHHVTDQQRDPLSQPTVVPEIFRVSPHLFKFNRPGEGSNFSILVADSGRALVSDCGLMSAEFLDRALAGMREHLGLKSIDAMVISHMHGDHFLLGDHLRQNYGAQIWTLDRIADPCEHPERYDYAAMIQSYHSGLDRLAIDRRLRDGEVIEWEAYRLQADWMPGQTEFGCCLWLEVDGQRVAFTGDNLFGDPSDTQQDGHEALVARNSAILEEGYLYAADYLKRLQPDLLMGGHSFVMPHPQAFIDRYQRWAQTIVQAYRSLSPDPDYRYRFDPYWVKGEPYRVTVAPGATVQAEVVVRNFRDRDQQHDIAICTPPGITADPEVWDDRVAGGSRARFPVRFTADPTVSAGVHIVALDITLDGRRYGQWFDMILEVTR